MSSNPNTLASTAGDAIEYAESTTITFEWTLRGLKQLFDSSKGEVKSKVTKSVKFGGGCWQVLFYANSGHEGGNYVSLYLSCEPTEDEKERSINGKWVREGLFKFSFEIRNVNRGALTSPKEACDHAFTNKTANWGWAQFAKRDAVFYTPNTVRHVDAFLVICNITTASVPPSPGSPIPSRTVPKGLLHVVGDLLDDPTYSDVCFVLPAKRRRGNRGRMGKAKIIYAAKRILQRVDYFNTMFSSGFAEGIPDAMSAGKPFSGGFGRSYRGADSISLSVASGDYGYEYDDNREDDYDGYTDYWSQDPFEDSDEDSSDEEYDVVGDHDTPTNHDGGMVDDRDGEQTDPLTPSNIHFPSNPITTSQSHPQLDSRSFPQLHRPMDSSPDLSLDNSRTPLDRNLAAESFRNSVASNAEAFPSSYTPLPMSAANFRPVSPHLNEELLHAHEGKNLDDQDLGDARDDVSVFTASETIREGPTRTVSAFGSPIEGASDMEDNTTLSTRSMVSLSEDGDLHASRKGDAYAEHLSRQTNQALKSPRDSQVIGSPNRRTSSVGDVPTSRQNKENTRDMQKSIGITPRGKCGSLPPYSKPGIDETNTPGPKKTKVIVKECEYATYYAVLYYLYTDSIVFSPLTSDFISKSPSGSPTASQTFPETQNTSRTPPYGRAQTHQRSTSSHYSQYNSQSQGRRHDAGAYGQPYESPHRSRKEWIRSWVAANPGRPRPCSAKACYRLADKLGLNELKARAFQHIVKSLTVSNVSHEIFSSFSAAFEDVRKVQVSFFLANWSEIKSSETMRNVFQQVRLGRHPGFEEVWPLIIMNLEFVPRALPETGADAPKEALSS